MRSRISARSCGLLQGEAQAREHQPCLPGGAGALWRVGPLWSHTREDCSSGVRSLRGAQRGGLGGGDDGVWCKAVVPTGGLVGVGVKGEWCAVSGDGCGLGLGLGRGRGLELGSRLVTSSGRSCALSIADHRASSSSSRPGAPKPQPCAVSSGGSSGSDDASAGSDDATAGSSGGSSGSDDASAGSDDAWLVTTGCRLASGSAVAAGAAAVRPDATGATTRTAFILPRRGGEEQVRVVRRRERSASQYTSETQEVKRGDGGVKPLHKPQRSTLRPRKAVSASTPNSHSDTTQAWPQRVRHPETPPTSRAGSSC
eukprot:scaffold42707_cov60-Phaeocystis_antarctica.AAC.5